MALICKEKQHFRVTALLTQEKPSLVQAEYELFSAG